MDYARLNRRELQVLCKEHGIPANKTNAFMAEALGALLNAPKEGHQQMGESIPDPAELVKFRTKKAGKSKKVNDVGAVEVDDLASHLSLSTITCDSSPLGMVEPAGGTVADAIIGEPEEIQNAAEAAKARRKPRTQTSRKGAKSNSIEADAAEDAFTNSGPIVESLMEVVLSTTEVPSTAVEEMAHEPIAPTLSQMYSRRVSKTQESDAPKDMSAAIVAEADTAAVLLESTVAVQDDASVEPIVVQEAMGGAKSLAKKSKSKGKKPTKLKPTSPAPAPGPEDGSPTLGGEINLCEALGSFGSTPMDEDLPLPAFVETISQIPPFILDQSQDEEEVPLATKFKGKGTKTTKTQPIISPSTADTSEDSSTGAEEADNVLLAALKTISPTTETFLVAKTSKVKGKGKKSTKMQPISPSPVDTSEDSSTAAEMAENVLNAALNSLSPATETFLGDQILPGVYKPEEAMVRAKPLSKKSKTKVKRVTKVKTLVVTAQNPQIEMVPTLTDDDCSLTADINSREVFQAAESPAFGLALGSDTTEDMIFGSRLSPAAEDEAFEFHPVPSSLNEILSPTPPEDLVGLDMKGCQHRAGRKSGLACTSCASERKVASVMQDVLQSMDIPEVHRGEDMLQENISSADDEFRKTTVKTEVVVTTPVKEGDDKENSLKNVDLHSLSIRKLQKEVQKRGLSKRSNTRSTKIH